ncbi:hypothetical protein AZE42_01492 [Rhizopogon vesiculosus]|uniref:Uncharacterized protein n=1 Tax=Rhizopogon vesiculosus TaxID=180088 RepID=A0A1J8PPL9_9AGAM|nr:hypothetical protein AZE42_01492 [Rhizopogon vesiculosus]
MSNANLFKYTVQAGKNISQYKSRLPVRTERFVSNVSAHGDVSPIPFRLTTTKKRLDVQSTAPSYIKPMTGKARPFRSLIPHWIGKPAQEKPCVRVPVPTIPLPKAACTTETARATRLRKRGPPSFKPISRAISNNTAATEIHSVDSSSATTVRRPWAVVTAKHLATRDMSSQTDHSRSRLSITDLQISSQPSRLVAPRCSKQAVRQCPKQAVKALSDAMKNRETRRPSPTVYSPASTAPLPSSPPHIARQSGQFEAAAAGGNSTSTTPKGDPPVRTNAHVPRDVRRVTGSRCNVEMKDCTSTTPKGWPMNCADLFAPSSDDAYVPPRRISERLKRAPRMPAYRLLRDDCDATPSPCVRDSRFTAPKTPLRPPATIFSSSLLTPSGRHLRPFQLPSPKPFQLPPLRPFHFTTSPPSPPQTFVSQVAPLVPSDVWYKNFLEMFPPLDPSLEKWWNEG